MTTVLSRKYGQKCEELAVDPLQAVVNALEDVCDEDGDSKGTGELILCGSSKGLFNNRLDGMQICALGESLLDNKSIVHLDLSYNFIDDAGAQTIAHLIKINRGLNSIDLKGNDITSKGANALSVVLTIPPGFEDSNNIEMFSLNGNPIGDDGACSVALMLQTNFQIKVVDIGNGDVGEKGIISICSALSKEGPMVEVLGLERPLLRGSQDNVAMHIARMLAANHCLKSINLGKFEMVDGDFETIVAYGLTKNSSVCELDLRGNRLSGFSEHALNRLLVERGNLYTLNLAANRLGNPGACVLAECLPYCALLKHIDLRNNGIGESGLIALAGALNLSANIGSCLIWGNTFGPVSCRAFKELLDGLRNDCRPFITDIELYEVDEEVKVAVVDI